MSSFKQKRSLALLFGELQTGAGSKRLHKAGKLRDRRARRVLC